MSLLLDENLSPRLTVRLAALFPGLLHVRDIGLKSAPDPEIWDYARLHGHTIVSADADFVLLAEQRGAPPQVIYLPQCDFPAAVIEELLRRNAVRIAEFLRDPGSSVLVIRP
jgi:predicted nuclease of predicted toxin-antitoxin system